MYRIVHNEHSATYRVERRGLLGWSCVSDPATGDYLGFRDLEAAHRWVRGQNAPPDGTRRWKVVSDCGA